MTDPHAKRWLVDDPKFLASLNDLDRGLLAEGGDGESEEDVDVEAAPPPSPPPPPRPAAVPVAPPPSHTRAINTARAMDPSRVLDTPLSRPLPPAATPALAPPPPLAFARPPAATRPRRPLLDLFPPSALDADRPPAMGSAVAPQLPSSHPRTAPPEDEAPSALDGLTYETFYGLREKPFNLSTDPRFLYHSAAFEHASQDVMAASRKRSGPVVLTAPLGMGKTTLCRALVAEIDRRTVTSLVLDPLEALDDVIKTMLVDFGVIARDDLAAVTPSREQLIATLNQFLESLVPLQANAVLILDEAQRMPVPLLGDLAVLLHAESARALQLVLVGQPTLTALLTHPDLRGLNASVARRIELAPLAADEISGYVMHRLSIAGAHTRIEFADTAIARLHELSKGSPRLVNVLCDRALMRGQAASAAVIDGGLIDAAAADVDLDRSAGDGPGAWTALAIAVLFALLTLAGAAGALWVYRDAVARTIQQWENIPLSPGAPVPRLPAPLPAQPENSEGRFQSSD